MFKPLDALKQSVVFIILVLVLGLALSQVPDINSFAYMMIPAVATFIMMFLVTGEGYHKAGWKKLGLHKTGIKLWLFSLIVPIIPIALSYSIVWTGGFADLITPDTILGFSLKAFPVAILIIFISNVLTNSLGEELGWRGYLFPKLSASLGFKQASLITGLVHGIWHFPMILFTTQYHNLGNKAIILTLMVLSTVALAPVIGYVRMVSGSVWPSSVLHTSHNLAWAVFAAISSAATPATEYLAGDTGIVGILCYALLSIWVFKKTQPNGVPAD
ncbi:type II CAAX prenyl endopeptidase Rce1 family protein [Paenibacillus sp. sgz500958]|uniref:CPBP family glutamic-type intramembrane protease n=1 Tax=Paenibacillus sp. sgz500958 TaxID=3242475 RepID=UPI0036D2B445